MIGNQSGQSTIEYIFLLAVIVTLTNIVFKNDLFKKYFGDEDGIMTAQARKFIEHTYRHGFEGQKIQQINYNERHESYQGNDSSRIFTPTGAYPK